MTRLKKIEIVGFRVFDKFEAEVENLQVLVGANGAGKSSFFEFLRFLRAGATTEIPYQIVTGWPGQCVFYDSKREDGSMGWSIDFDVDALRRIRYRGALLGPVGKPVVPMEHIYVKEKDEGDWEVLASREMGEGFQSELKQNHEKLTDKFTRVPLQLGSRQMLLSVMNRSSDGELKQLRDAVADWAFYESQHLEMNKIRRPVLLSSGNRLEEDGGNLSSVLHTLMTEHHMIFRDLKTLLRAVVPGFEDLAVKQRGGHGEVIATWKEKHHSEELSLADLSYGTLKLLCWMVLCLQPEPPSLMCVDEPDEGLHPRVLPVLAGLFEKASQQTQIFLTTHSSYFLSQFPLDCVAVLKKETGGAVFRKASNSASLRDILQDFGTEELELMHRSDELEALA
jgi:predicted ATPase